MGGQEKTVGRNNGSPRKKSEEIQVLGDEKPVRQQGSDAR